MISDSILIVEDDHEIRFMLSDALREEGFTVLTAANGQDALTLLRTDARPALIFLDFMMPIMNGHQFLDALSEDPTLSSIPVVVMSASAGPDKVKGVHSFIKKPFDFETVLKTAQQHCNALPARS